MKQTEREFYDRCNKIDADDGFGWLMAHCICAIVGGVVGVLVGYFVRAIWGPHVGAM